MEQEQASVGPTEMGNPCKASVENPLENHVVIKEVIKYVKDLDTLKSARLVNKQWNEVCAVTWNALRKTLTLVPSTEFSDDDDDGSSDDNDESFDKDDDKDGEDEDYSFHRENGDAVMMLEDMKAFHDEKNSLLKKYPYRHCILQGWTLNIEETNQLNLRQWLWTTYGKYMTHFKFSECIFHCGLMPLQKQFLENVPNLKVLELLNCEFDSRPMNFEDSDDEDFPELPDEDDKYKHLNLATVKLTRVRVRSTDRLNIAWMAFLLMAPKLERICLKEVNSNLKIGKVLTGTLPRAVKTLDVMDFSIDAELLLDNAYRLPQGFLEELHLDIGYQTEIKRAREIIERHKHTLKKLVLYRAPLFSPLPNFGLELDQLTELYLWGSATDSLNFLQFLPALKVLVWNVGCFEKRDKFVNVPVSGSHSRSRSRKVVHLTDMDLVENSVIPVDFRMIKMEHLEFDWGPLEIASWRKLGRWMPHLKGLKGKVIRDEQLFVIADQWKELERVELAHGSELQTGRGITVALGRLSGLKGFGWKGCGCTKKSVKLSEERKQEVEEALRNMVGEEGILAVPWRSDEEYEVCDEQGYRLRMDKVVLPSWGSGRHHSSLFM